jgi:hypothetical protein
MSLEAKIRQAARAATTQVTGQAAQPEAAAPIRGTVGVKLASNQIVTTQSGRVTTLFPRVNFETPRKAVNTCKAVDQWLISNALQEAIARGDRFNELQFQAISLLSPSESDKDSAEEYLFGDYMPPVAVSIFRQRG